MRADQISSGSAEATIVPGRGGLVTRFAVSGREILFLDRASFEDRGQPVRGGIPVLFPFAGRLADNLLLATGTSLGLHGFARDLEWTVTGHGADRHRMELVASPEILETYPFAHRLTQTTSVADGELSLGLVIENRSPRPMPVAPGWHPYFRCPRESKAGVRYGLADFPCEQLGDSYDFGLEAPAAGRIDFDIPGEGGVSLSFSPGFRHLQFWTLPDRDFICVEPWDGPPGVINSDRGRLVSPGGTLTCRMRISPPARES